MDISKSDLISLKERNRFCAAEKIFGQANILISQMRDEVDIVREHQDLLVALLPYLETYQALSRTTDGLESISPPKWLPYLSFLIDALTPTGGLYGDPSQMGIVKAFLSYASEEEVKDGEV